jgi:phage pi2 protein 07
MNNTNITPEQQMIIEKVEYQLSNIKDQDFLYSSIRDLLYNIPNNYDLGVTIRKLFS